MSNKAVILTVDAGTTRLDTGVEAPSYTIRRDGNVVERGLGEFRLALKKTLKHARDIAKGGSHVEIRGV